MVTREQLNGDPPKLAGRACEGFLCESFVYEGKVEASANVTHLRFAGAWYRLYFEPGLIFWRVSSSDPMAWAVPEEGWSYPHTDIAELVGLIGEVLEAYEMEADDSSVVSSSASVMESKWSSKMKAIEATFESPNITLVPTRTGEAPVLAAQRRR